MKAEINNENKAKFFAMYSGQKVFCNPEDPDIEDIDQEYLLLKSLSQISDEDSIEVAKLYGWDLKKPYVILENQIKTIKQKLVFFNQGKINIIYNVCDYLRSRGYALPWMGLSVEKMIEAGWIKLAE